MHCKGCNIKTCSQCFLIAFSGLIKETYLWKCFIFWVDSRWCFTSRVQLVSAIIYFYLKLHWLNSWIIHILLLLRPGPPHNYFISQKSLLLTSAIRRNFFPNKKFIWMGISRTPWCIIVLDKNRLYYVVK